MHSGWSACIAPHCRTKNRVVGQERLIFLHVPKAAGRTVTSILVRQYHDKVAEYRGFLSDANIEFNRDPELAHVVLGHFAYGIHRRLPGRWSYLTILRDPVERVVSLHRYICRNERHPLHESVRTMGLGEFVTSGIGHEEVDNGQVRQISGVLDRRPSERTLEIAKENLATFGAVGLVERFDESVMTMKKRFRWKVPLYRKMNITQRDPRTQGAPTAEEVEAVREHNRLDLDLYRFAAARLDDQVSALGARFALELLAFRASNGLAGKLRGGPAVRRTS